MLPGSFLFLWNLLSLGCILADNLIVNLFPLNLWFLLIRLNNLLIFLNRFRSVIYCISPHSRFILRVGIKNPSPCNSVHFKWVDIVGRGLFLELMVPLFSRYQVCSLYFTERHYVTFVLIDLALLNNEVATIKIYNEPPFNMIFREKGFLSFLLFQVARDLILLKNWFLERLIFPLLKLVKCLH